MRSSYFGDLPSITYAVEQGARTYQDPVKAEKTLEERRLELENSLNQAKLRLEEARQELVFLRAVTPDDSPYNQYWYTTKGLKSDIAKQENNILEAEKTINLNTLELEKLNAGAVQQEL